MAAGVIEKMGLVKRIEELIAAGTASGQAISDALKAEGHAVSQPTISRYLKKTRESRRETTQTIVDDHIQKHVPADLTALETMEAQCLEWANENNDQFAHRLAARRIEESLNKWLEIIQSINPALHAGAPEELSKARSLAVEEIMGQCIRWVADEFAVQKARLAAMRQGSGIIEMKLRFAGVIGGANEGQVIVITSDEARERLQKDAQTGQLRLVEKAGGR